jgi:hypothetical protein
MAARRRQKSSRTSVKESALTVRDGVRNLG